MLKLLGIILIVLGVVALVFQWITYKTQENVIALGPIHSIPEENKTGLLPTWRHHAYRGDRATGCRRQEKVVLENGSRNRDDRNERPLTLE